MGQKPGKENYKAKVASYITPVENLFLSGHWSELVGGVPIAVKSTINTSLIVIPKQNKKDFQVLAKNMVGEINLEQL